MDPESAKSTIEHHRNRMYVSFGLNFAATILGFYLVARKSPKNMGTYKYILLDIVIWSFVMDIVYTLLWMPLLMMPAPAICIVGLLKFLGQFNGNGTCFLTFMVTYVGCNMSCSMAQFYRVVAGTGRSTRFFSYPHNIAAAVILHFLPATPGIAAYFFALELDDQALNAYFIAKFPKGKFIFEALPCGGFIIDDNHEKWKVFFGTCFVCLFFNVLSGVLMLSYLLRSLKTALKTSVSLKSVQLQRQLILTLVVQSCLPTVCLGIPYLITVLASICNNDILSEVAVALVTIGSLHSVFHTCVLIFMIRPYKMAFWGFIRRNIPSEVSGNSPTSKRISTVALQDVKTTF